ncbi:MAG: hypothetical protein VX000_05355, partial [Myxococcota bacterium]|nr:hypothetical protein [Myxococcota bacterium]
MARHAVLSLLLVATACQQVDGGTRNVPPVAVLVSHADGDVVREGYAETLRGAVGDADHGLDDLSISWRVDGVEVCADATADGQGRVVCAHSFLATGGEVTLEVRDPVGGTAAAGASLAVRSTDVAVDLTPDPAFTTDTLLADVSEMSDAEGLRPLTYSYVWYADDAVSPASVSERFPSSETSKHRKYRVVVTPSNGVSSGPPVEAEVTIANAAPELVGPTLSADVVQVGDVLECSATATDADADDAPAIAYAWEDGGTAAAHSVTTADVPGTTLSCTATADDGDGGTASSTV